MKFSNILILLLIVFVGCVSKTKFDTEQRGHQRSQQQFDSLVTANKILTDSVDSLRRESQQLLYIYDSLRTAEIIEKSKPLVSKNKNSKKGSSLLDILAERERDSIAKINRGGIGFGIAYKPIIYCYPTDTTDLTVKVTFSQGGKFTYTYPTYPNSGWQVTAFPDGRLLDKQGKSYYSLFWEGEHRISPDDSTGFVVHRDSLKSFFERTLDSLGLNYKEKQEFIVYWSPKLMESEYSFIHFSRKNHAQSAKMDIVPQPESLNRFLMLYRKASADEKPVPQTLENPGRKGFTVVEWGGAEMNNIQMRVQ